MKRIIILALFFITTNFCFSYGWEDVNSARFGIKAGFGFSRLTGLSRDSDGYFPGTYTPVSSMSAQLTPSWEIGLVLQTTFHKNIFFQSELMYTKYGTKVKGAYLENYGYGKRIKAIELHGLKGTFNFGKKIGLGSTACLAFGGGFYFSYNFIEDNIKLDVVGSDRSDADINSLIYDFDIGPTALAAVESGRIQVGLNFAYGLMNVVDGYSRSKNIELKLGAIYFF